MHRMMAVSTYLSVYSIIKGRREIRTIRKLMRCLVERGESKSSWSLQNIKCWVGPSSTCKWASSIQVMTCSDFRKATISLKQRLTQTIGNSGWWAAISAHRDDIMSKFLQCQLICDFHMRVCPCVNTLVLNAMYWPTCVPLRFFDVFLSCEIQFILWPEGKWE